MNIPYIVGEKLFNVFDSNKNSFLTESEFVSGIINLYSGSLEETEKVIFDLLDFDFDGKIIPEDSRLLISFIKNLANAPNEILKKIKPRNTLSDEEDLEEINIIIKNFFGEYSVMNFEEFKNQIESHNSDVFFLFICFLYNNKPYFESSIRVLKQSSKSNVNINSSRNSFLNSSFDNSFNAGKKARIRSPSIIFKNFI
jgi:Ca2+-binding EF-hand superfamily protein